MVGHSQIPTLSMRYALEIRALRRAVQYSIKFRILVTIKNINALTPWKFL